MADKTYVALIEDDHEIDVRDPDIIRVAPLDVYRETILDTEGITDDNVGEFAKLEGINVATLIEVMEATVNFAERRIMGNFDGAYEWQALIGVLEGADLLSQEAREELSAIEAES